MAIDRSAVLKSAQLLASKGQFDAAISEWKKLSADSPGDGSVFNSIGELHLKRNANNDAVAAFLQAANAFRAEGATLKAIATFKKVLKLDPQRYDVFRHLGDLNAERGLLSSAVQDYLTLGKHYLKAGKTKEALEVYKTIVTQDPSNLDAQQRVAELCLQENMQDEATKVYLQLGRERSAQQRHAEAKDAYQAVLRIDPANSEAAQFIEQFKKTGKSPGDIVKTGTGSAGSPLKNLEPLDLLSEAMRRIEGKQYDGAEAILNQMLTKEPGNPEVCQLLAKLHLERGDLQVAFGEYRYLAGAALRAQDYVKAESLITDFLAVEPQSVAMLELYGELYAEKGDAANAVLLYGKAIELLLEHPEPGMPTLHEELFEKVTALAPDSPTVKRLAALMHGTAVEQPPVQSQTKTSASSTADLPSRPAPVEPPQLTASESATPSSGLSLSSTESGARKEALPQVGGTDVPLSTREQFQAYMKAGQQAEAEAWLNRLISAQPDNAEVQGLLGFVLETNGNTVGAVMHYACALELFLAHTSDENSSQLAGLYAKIKKLAPADPAVSKWASTFSPKAQATVPAVETPVSAPLRNGIDAETHYTLGVAYKNMGLLEEAKEEFSFSMRSADFFSDSCLMLAVCLKEQGKCQSASTQLELLLQDPKCQGAKAQAIRYELGLLYEVQEQWSQAIVIYESISTFHDVPQRLESIRARTAQAEPTPVLPYGR